MSATLAVHPDELVEVIADDDFMALPKEEIARHFATIEVVPRADGLVELEAYVVAHHNYSWLTYAAGSGRRCLGISAPLTADLADDLFLDESWCAVAARAVDQSLALPTKPEVRLAGLINGDPLGVVFVARLGQREARSRDGTLPDLVFRGIGDLLHDRAHLDARSRLLVDHLEAL